MPQESDFRSQFLSASGRIKLHAYFGRGKKVFRLPVYTHRNTNTHTHTHTHTQMGVSTYVLAFHLISLWRFCTVTDSMQGLWIFLGRMSPFSSRRGSFLDIMRTEIWKRGRNLMISRVLYLKIE